MNNYSAAVNRGYFRAEDVESGEKIPELPVPKREGYVFTGWYTETEAINLWDFDTKTEIPDGEEEPDIVEREDGSCLIDGQCPFFDLLTHFGMDGTPLDNAYNTVSGLFLDLTGHIPQTGEHLDWKGLRLEIVDMDGVRIDKILVKRITTPEA